MVTMRSLLAVLTSALALAVLLLAFGSHATPMTSAEAGEPECYDTPEGQVCVEVDEPTCQPPECAAPPVIHVWPDPVGATTVCAGSSTDNSTATNCPPINVVVAANGGGFVARITPRTPGVPTMADLTEHPKYGGLISGACQSVGLAPDCGPYRPS